MKKYFFGALFLLCFSFASHVNAAIVVDATSTFKSNSCTNNCTWSQTVTSTANTVLFVSANCEAVLATTSGVSYNGVALTKLWEGDTGLGVGGTYNSGWILLNPSSGTHNVSTSFTGCSGGYASGMAVSLVGVNNTSLNAALRATSTAGTNAGGAVVVSSTFPTSQNGDYLISALSTYSFIPTWNLSTFLTSSTKIGGGLWGNYTIGGLANGSNATTSWGNVEYGDMGVADLIPADLTPPVSVWIAPSANSTVSSTITLTASSTDNVAVSSTAFYVGSYGGTFASSTLIGSTSTASGTQYSIPWNTSSTANGSSTLWVQATDTSNNTSTAASTTVNVENPPVISAVASSTSLTTSTITWTTNEAATSQVNYGLTSAYGSSTQTSTLATSHTLTLTNLTPSSTYHFEVLATDAEGNTSTSSDKTFTTTIDSTPPSIPTSVLATAISTTEIDLSWATSTDNVAVAGYEVVRQGTQIATTTNPSYANTGLSPNTTYSYVITAFDAAGNVSASSTAASATTPSNSTSVTPPVATVEVAAGYKVGYPPGYVFNPTSTSGDGSGDETSGNASIESTIASLQAELETLLAEAGQGTGGGSTAPSPYPFTRNLSLWSIGPDVTALQEFLIKEDTGPAAQALATHGTTQYFGFLTFNALKEYQASVGLPATGYFGTMTQKYLGVK